MNARCPTKMIMLKRSRNVVQLTDVRRRTPKKESVLASHNSSDEAVLNVTWPLRKATIVDAVNHITRAKFWNTELLGSSEAHWIHISTWNSNEIKFFPWIFATYFFYSFGIFWSFKNKEREKDGILKDEKDRDMCYQRPIWPVVLG